MARRLVPGALLLGLVAFAAAEVSFLSFHLIPGPELMPVCKLNLLVGNDVKCSGCGGTALHLSPVGPALQLPEIPRLHQACC